MNMRPIKIISHGDKAVAPGDTLIQPPTQAAKEKLALYFMKQLGYPQDKANRIAGL